jgi:hypothetical protein
MKIRKSSMARLAKGLDSDEDSYDDETAFIATAKSNTEDSIKNSKSNMKDSMKQKSSMARLAKGLDSDDSSNSDSGDKASVATEKVYRAKDLNENRWIIDSGATSHCTSERDMSTPMITYTDASPN